MTLNQLSTLTSNLPSTKKMPALFIGHGSPMNAIEQNVFSKEWQKLGTTLPTPTAIICISAHWETNGTFITAMKNPRTIHDFGGFPQRLFDVQYPAPGHPELAQDLKALSTEVLLELDQHWGLDHGSWSILNHLYPDANIPVLQLSIDYSKPPLYHYQLGQYLQQLRLRGILFIGSGNMVHNLRMVDWANLDKANHAFDWAIEANSQMKSFIDEFDHKALINFEGQGSAFKLAIPTTEHFIPLLYTLGLSTSSDEVSYFNDVAVGGSLTMTSVQLS